MQGESNQLKKGSNFILIKKGLLNKNYKPILYNMDL
jgi:hypothetical protein